VWERERVDLAAAYRDGQQRFASLVPTLGSEVDRTVPLTPEWRVRDVLAHVIGVAEDFLASNFPDFSDPKGHPQQAVARERWTEKQVQRRRPTPVPVLLEQWERMSQELQAALAAADDLRYPIASRTGATFDLACHLHDVRHAVGRPGDRDADATGPRSRSRAPGLASGCSRRVSAQFGSPRPRRSGWSGRVSRWPVSRPSPSSSSAL
jgi:uncharacterized protein (TIGR03083 family)